MIDNNTTLSSAAVKPVNHNSGSWSGQQPAMEWCNKHTSEFSGEDTYLGNNRSVSQLKEPWGASI